MDNPVSAEIEWITRHNVIEIEENERFHVQNGWSALNLTSSDPAPFVYDDGDETSDVFPADYIIIDKWEFSSSWEVNAVEGSSGGWCYGESFAEICTTKVTPQDHHVVRRRKWIRFVTQRVPSSLLYENDEVSLSRRPKSRRMKPIDNNSRDNNSKFSLVIGSVDQDESESVSSKGSKEENPLTRLSTWSFTFRRRGSPSKTNSTKALMVLTPTVSPTKSARKLAQKVNNQALVAIGRQIKLLEDQAADEDKATKKAEKEQRRPLLAEQIQVLESICKDLSIRIEKEVCKGLSHIEPIEEELRQHIERLEIFKKQYYFPQSTHVLGSGGVYLGLDDWWLQEAAGSLTLDLMPNQHTSASQSGQGSADCFGQSPAVYIALTGSQVASKYISGKHSPTKSLSASKETSMEGSGITLRLRLEGVRSAGDKGKNIPRLELEAVDIIMVVNLTTIVSFDLKTRRWDSSSSNAFHLDVLSFKGPYGISKSIVSPLLSLLSPSIRKLVVSLLPIELGLLVHSFPTPFSMRGQFSVAGELIAELTKPLHESELAAKLTKWPLNQQELFVDVQRGMERSRILRSLYDIIAYRRSLERHPKIWPTLVVLWDEAIRIFLSKLPPSASATSFSTLSSFTSLSSMPLRDKNQYHQQQEISPMTPRSSKEAAPFTFSHLLHILDEGPCRKHLTVDIKLQQVDGQVSVSHLVTRAHEFVRRMASRDKSSTALLLAKAKETILKNDLFLSFSTKLLRHITQNLDFAHSHIRAKVKTGLRGTFDAAIHELFAQAPLMVKSSITGGINLGLRPPVPTLVTIQPSFNGEVNIEVLHVSPNGLDADVGLSSNRATQIGDRVMIKRNMREETSEYKDFDETTYLEDLMTRSPQDDSANLCVKVAVACPEVSLVVDQSASLKAGAALFSLRLGHRDQDDRPILDYCGDSEDSSELGNNEKVNVNSSIVEGCPISVFTSGGIRVITQIPRIEVEVNLPDILLYALAHFADKPLLKLYLIRNHDADPTEDELSFAELLIERFTKYALRPGIALNLNIRSNAKVVAGDVIVAFETPTSNTGFSSPSNEPSKSSKSDEDFALRFHADFLLRDIFEDVASANLPTVTK